MAEDLHIFLIKIKKFSKVGTMCNIDWIPKMAIQIKKFSKVGIMYNIDWIPKHGH